MSRKDDASGMEGALRERFGLERFRPGQREVIESVLARRDVLCVMPTGGGKSLCYQLPAVLTPGLTLVVSPLIALMKDQVDALSARGVRAALLNSTLDPSEQRIRLMEAEAGKYDLLYVAPERFRSPRFVAAMAQVRPALLAVDEAHCISEWGHDFRPDYAQLGRARRALGMPPCIALTATATDLVRRDIADQLDLREPELFVTGFDRPNLSYRVVQTRRDEEKLAALGAALDRARGPAIVYASSRKRCEGVARYLQAELRKTAVVYHAGLTREDRTEAQDRFMNDEAEIVVATNAFGMGVDKAAIRSVIHFNMPGTLEAYYQEAGRAGRDGEPAQCVLLYAPGDRRLQEIFIENEYPAPDTVHQVYEYLRRQDADPIELTHAEIRERSGSDLHESAIGTAIKILEGAEALERFLPRENMAIVRINSEPDEPSLVKRLSAQAHVQRVVLTGLEGLVGTRYGEPIYFSPDEFAGALGLDRTALSRALREITGALPVDYIPPFRGNAIRIADRSRRARDLEIDFKALNQRKKQEYEKLDRMIGYAHTMECRRLHILSYFGDKSLPAGKCGGCDNCGGAIAGPGATAVAIDTDAGREVIVKTLSGVARARGRFGRVAIAQMLVGSGSERMERSGLDRLSTFGLLAACGFNKAEVTDLLDALAVAGLAREVEVGRFRPVLELSERGWDYVRLRGAPDLALGLAAPLARKVRAGGTGRGRTAKVEAAADEPVQGETGPRPAAVDAADPGLLEALRALRSRLADEGKVPRYCVVSNETLECLAQVQPRDLDELATVKGIGPAKLEKYGAAILETIAATAPSVREPEPVVAEVVESRSAAKPVPTEEWTRRLLEQGFTIDEAATIRGLERSAVIRQLVKVASEGRAVPVSAFLPPADADRWDVWFREHGERTPPATADGPALDLWALYLACRQPGA